MPENVLSANYYSMFGGDKVIGFPISPNFGGHIPLSLINQLFLPFF